MDTRIWHIGDVVARTGAHRNPKARGVIISLTEKLARDEPVAYVKWGKRRPVRSILYTLANLTNGTQSEAPHES